MVGLDATILHPADLAPVCDGDLGYVRRLVSFCVVFGPQGQFVAAEDLVSWGPSGRSSIPMMLPRAQHRDAGHVVNFLWDRYGCQLGAGDVRGGKRAAPESARLEVYRKRHQEILGEVKDRPLATFLTFLDTWKPDFASISPGRRVPRVGLFVFRFQYDDEFLHERHAARLAWDRLYRRA